MPEVVVESVSKSCGGGGDCHPRHGFSEKETYERKHYGDKHMHRGYCGDYGHYGHYGNYGNGPVGLDNLSREVCDTRVEIAKEAACTREYLSNQLRQEAIAQSKELTDIKVMLKDNELTAEKSKNEIIKRMDDLHMKSCADDLATQRFCELNNKIDRFCHPTNTYVRAVSQSDSRDNRKD